MSDLGVEMGEVTMLPDEILKVGDGVDPRELRFAGKVVILPDESVWVDRAYRGKLDGIDNNTETIHVLGFDPTIDHQTTRVRWYNVVPRESQRVKERPS